MMKRVLCTALFLLFGSAAAHAQCTGSGTAWSCPSGTTTAQLATVIAAASNNAVITFASGTYNWSSNTNFSTTNGATLICASGATCIVNSTGTVLGLQGYQRDTDESLSNLWIYVHHIEHRAGNHLVRCVQSRPVVARLTRYG